MRSTHGIGRSPLLSILNELEYPFFVRKQIGTNVPCADFYRFGMLRSHKRGGVFPMKKRVCQLIQYPEYLNYICLISIRIH